VNILGERTLKRTRSHLSDTTTRMILAAAAFSSLAFLAGILVVLFREALPALRQIGFVELITGTDWYPTYRPPSFGAAPLIASSIQVTVGAMIVAVPLGLASALFMSEAMPARARNIIKPVVELLAGLPSVVYGLFGMELVAPLIMQAFDLPTGLTALSASIVLGIMALPTVTSVAEDALSAVPSACKEASTALGATRWETASKVVMPAASSGIITAVLLGVSRAIGETMAVLMVAGGAIRMPSSFLQPVRPITAAIAAEMGEAPVGSMHYHALFALAVILFLSTLAFNATANALKNKFKAKVE
jgi:phosphate transport system permease protein